MQHETVNPELFRWNRKRFAREMREDSVAVFCSNDEVGSNGNQHCRYRQNPDLYYLTGVTQPETVLVLAPNTAKQGFAEVLFVRRPDHVDARRAGTGLELPQAAQLSGIEQVLFVDALEGVLHELVLLASRVYVNGREDRHAYSEAPARDLRFAERLMRLYPAHKYHRAQPILKKIGMVKSAPEVGLISKAAELANVGLRACAKTLRAGAAEHAVEAAAVAAVIAGGAQGLAHPTRVAAGRRTLFPGYDANAGTLGAGELVSVQLGVTYAGYHASVARALPVDGAFDLRQREAYDYVVSALQFGTNALVPGATLPECEAALRDRLHTVCRQLGLRTARPGVDYAEGCYFHVGRHLRDPYLPYAPLQSGMVLACEPGVYLHDDGFGVQLRNVILVTDQGPVNLTASVPLAIDEVEALAGVTA